ncbi:MAG: universal stress protein [Parvularculaceae bacterium]
MILRDLLVFATSERDAPALALAKMVAAQTGGHVSCAAIAVLPMSVGDVAVQGMDAGYAMLAEQMNRDADKTLNAIAAAVSRSDPPAEFRPYKTFPAGVEEVAALNARHADLVIVRAPERKHRIHGDIIEGALLGGGRPVLVAPIDWKARAIGSNAVLAWDASREAARAAHDALLLLQNGARLTIVTIDSARRQALGEGPGRDIAAHLARHGLKVDVRNIESGRSTIAEAIAGVVTDIDADLLIMGGYRHARLQQALFGGVTRATLSDAKTPLLISH